MRSRSSDPSGQRPKMSLAPLGRAIRYLGRYRGIAAAAYIFLFLSTAAMLVVPQLVQNIIDAITNGFMAAQVEKVPAAFQGAVLEKLGWTTGQLASNQTGAETALVTAGVLILVFAVARGLFAFSHSYFAERTSQSVAFDLRNELYAKIQRLSFSYHDQNQTGQLMIRATDDVEKVRMFIGQGLLMATQAVIMLVATLIILMVTNFNLMLVVLPVLPVALILFMSFGALAQPLFMKVQQKLSTLNTVLQENLAGIKVIKAFVREPQQQARFNRSADDLMKQQIQVSRAVLVPLPGGLPGGQPGAGRRALLWRRTDHQRHADAGRMAEVQPVPGVCLLPAGHAGHDHLANVAGQRLGAARVRDPGRAERRGKQTRRAGPAAGAGQRRFRGGHLPLLWRRRSGLESGQLQRQARPDDRAAGGHRQRQEHHHQPDPALL